MAVIACVQWAPRKKAVQTNLDRMAELVLQAAGEKADLVVFPETSTSGYFLEGGVLECSLTTEKLEAEFTKRLTGLASQIDVALGFYEESGGELYNSAAYLECGPNGVRLVQVYRKFFLPTYGVFDEERFVGRGHEVAVFDTRFGKASMLICEDVWHSIMPTLCAVRGAHLLIVPSASPARGFATSKPGNVKKYETLLTTIAEEHGIFIANAMLTGYEGGKGFAGGSMIVDPTGNIVAQGPIQEEHMVIADVDFTSVELTRSRSPLLADLRAAWGDVVRAADHSL